MYLIPVVFFVFFQTASSAESQSSTELTSLLERHAVARGGVEALESVDSLALELEITEPAFIVQGRYLATRDGRVRVDIFADGQRVFSEALDTEGGWQWSVGKPDDIRRLSRDGLAALERGRIGNLYALHELADLGYRLSYRGLESLDGRDHHVVETLDPAGFQREVYLDPETFQVTAKVEVSALHPDIDAESSRQVTRALSYRTVDGIVFIANSQKVEMETGKLLQSASVTSLEVNPEVPEDYFNPDHRPVAVTDRK